MSLFRIGARPPPSFEDPVGILDSCHRKIEDRLAQLERALGALDDPEALEVLRGVVRHFDTAGVRHTEDEEASIFPRLAGTGAEGLTRELEADHRAAEAIYLALRTCVNRLLEEPALARAIAPELAAHGSALAAAYREHIRREDGELFPAIRALTPAELRAIGIEMRLRRGGAEP